MYIIAHYNLCGIIFSIKGFYFVIIKTLVRATTKKCIN